MKSITWILALTMMLSCHLAGAAAHQHIRVQTSYYEISREAFAKMLKGNQTEQPYQKVRKLVQSGQAALFHVSLLTCRPGESTRAASILEVIYPTEYSPPELCHLGSIGGRTSLGNDPLFSKPIDKTPTAFETRNVGASLEIMATLMKDGQHIKLMLEQELVSHPRNRLYLDFKDQFGNIRMSFPGFDSKQVDVTVTLTNKIPKLITAYTPHNKEGTPEPDRKIIVFAKATIVSP
ncbi:MAG: hypothetical protein KJO79_02070 [Verrucomicrobiae bacterium]|nr:hypothetical protein [Verrucomicrobiae bacterium]NNJ85939.1 hypothetical protein [Akkermansiaceae bacterium]